MITGRDLDRSRYLYFRVSGRGFSSSLAGSAADGHGLGDDVSVVSPVLVSISGVESNKVSTCSSNVSRSMSPQNAVRHVPNWSSTLGSLTVSSTISSIAHALLAPS